MTTSELIGLLRQSDPDGTTPVCVGNGAVIAVQMLPAYYDGALNVIECEDWRPVRGWRTRDGKKIEIEVTHVSDCIENYEDSFTVVYPTEKDRDRYELSDQRTKFEIVKITNEVHREFFTEWVWGKIQKIRPVPLEWVGRIRKAAEEFYDGNDMTPSWKEMPERIKLRRTKDGGWPSANERDCEWWDEQFFVNWDDYSRIVIRKKETA